MLINHGRCSRPGSGLNGLTQPSAARWEAKNSGTSGSPQANSRAKGAKVQRVIGRDPGRAPLTSNSSGGSSGLHPAPTALRLWHGPRCPAHRAVAFGPAEEFQRWTGRLGSLPQANRSCKPIAPRRLNLLGNVEIPSPGRSQPVTGCGGHNSWTERSGDQIQGLLGRLRGTLLREFVWQGASEQRCGVSQEGPAGRQAKAAKI